MPELSSKRPNLEPQFICRPLKGGKLPWMLCVEIRLVSCLILPLNRFLSPQRLARILEPRRHYPPPKTQYPLDLVCHLGWLLKPRAFKRQRYCIVRSFLLYRFLRRFGYPALLNFGLMGDCREEGHCWITVNGEVFYDETKPDQEFTTQVAASENVVYWI